MESHKNIKYHRKLGQRFSSVDPKSSVWVCDYRAILEGWIPSLSFLLSSPESVVKFQIRPGFVSYLLLHAVTRKTSLVRLSLSLRFYFISMAILHFSNSQQWSVINHLPNAFRVKGPSTSTEKASKAKGNELRVSAAVFRVSVLWENA